MNEAYNVLIFPAGTEIGLEINNALKYSKLVNVFGATSMPDHSKLVYKNYIEGLPFFSDESFINDLNEVIKQNKIDFIYPAHDSVVLFLTQHKNEISAKIITSELETVEICRSKEKTYEYLKNEDFVPIFYSSIDEIKEFPVFIKPDVGQGSVGAKTIMNKVDLIQSLSSEKMVICEFLCGTEYTVDCFTDKNGILKVAQLRDRNRIKSGISVNSKLCQYNKQVEDIARKINSKFKFNGAWFFQLKLNIKNEFKLLEISPRIPGTMGLSRNLGVNFPLLTIYNNLNFDVNLIENDYKIEVDRAFINRYIVDLEYDFVYVDLDDTLIIRDNVNIFLIMFLYQCANQNKKIILITRHIKEIEDTLNKFKINKNLFNEIIHIKDKSKKSVYVKENNAIFIDDSFAERKDVREKLGINVYDLDMIESLIDWRV